MKILAINGSANANGNTHMALEIVADILKKEKVDVEIIDLVNKDIHPYSVTPINDDIPKIYEVLKKCEGLILASPVYYSNVTSRMQMFIERMGVLSEAPVMKGKVGASIAICRRQGANFAYAAMNFFFGIKQMPIATSSYWNILIGKKPGDIKKDEEGMRILNDLANNMANMIKKLNA